MSTHDWRPRTGCVALSFVGLALLAAPSANAAVTSDLPNFNLSTTSATWPTSFITTTSSGIQYRWLTAPTKTTVMASANCATNATYGSAVIVVGSTVFQTMGAPVSGTCFNVRGYTTSGTMLGKTGRVSR